MFWSGTEAAGTHQPFQGGEGSTLQAKAVSLLWWRGTLGEIVSSRRAASVGEGGILLGQARRSVSPQFPLPVNLSVDSFSHSLSAFVDSETDTEFMDRDLARRLGIKRLGIKPSRHKLPSPDSHKVLALDGH